MLQMRITSPQWMSSGGVSILELSFHNNANKWRCRRHPLQPLFLPACLPATRFVELNWKWVNTVVPCAGRKHEGEGGGVIVKWLKSLIHHCSSWSEITVISVE